MRETGNIQIREDNNTSSHQQELAKEHQSIRV